MTQAPRQNSQWISPAILPPPPRSVWFVTEPLDPAHAELDFEALMSCRVRLREELQWGEWPAEDFTLKQNLEDLRRHRDEFDRGQAFAYTVLSPDRSRCLGCIYIERCDDIDGVQLAYWVIDDCLILEASLVTVVVDWLRTSWPIQRVLLPFREANQLGIALAKACGLKSWESDGSGPLSEHSCYLWEASG